MLKILLVEDNLADQRLALEAFKSTEVACEVEISPDGRQALTLLTDAADRQQRLPDLILLDLNLPRLSGRDVLRAIKNDSRLKHIPVLVLSSSTSPEDIQACYDLHANCYLIKPMDVDRFFELIRNVEALWFPQVERLRANHDALAPFQSHAPACSPLERLRPRVAASA